MKVLYVTDLHGDKNKYRKSLDIAVEKGISVIINGGDMLPKLGERHLEQPVFIINREWKLIIVFLRGLNVVLHDGNGRMGRLILFRECLKNGIVPVVIEDVNRNEYLDALKEYREEKGLNKMIRLFEKEQQFYLDRCKYFM